MTVAVSVDKLSIIIVKRFNAKLLNITITKHLNLTSAKQVCLDAIFKVVSLYQECSINCTLCLHVIFSSLLCAGDY